MYEIVKAVILEGRYELSDLLKKIDTLWVQGGLTEEEKTELVQLAREEATPENSFAGIQKQMDTLFTNLAEIAKQVGENTLTIASIKAKLEEQGTVVPDPEPEPGEEYPEYVQPTGAHDAYHNGDKVTYQGKKYHCIAPEDVAVVWPPDVYPAYWEEDK
ncbi:MAG TPA: hypothetical protein IAB48_10865 [Candidatus Fimimorpha excrementavium]|nr:hypothetical protein [Candidatus Fimimorpha excrementavium]